MKPILFNTEMVRAILEGRKTVTRRVVKGNTEGLYAGKCLLGTGLFDEKTNQRVIEPPYKVNDILYVRETWGEERGDFYYKADIPKDDYEAIALTPWRPSIHMPKEAARIFLRVTSVRVERLQDICNRGTPQDHVTNMTREGLLFQNVMENYQKLIDDFKQLWNSTIKRDQLQYYSWNANPYVWVIEFERVEREEVL